MVHVGDEVVIAKPLADVFTYAADINHYADWATGVTELRPDAADLGAFIMRRDVGGRQIATRFRVVELVLNRHFTLRGVSAGSPWTSTVTFESVDGVTRVREALELEVRGAARLISPLLRRVISKTNRADLDGLKHRLDMG